MTQTPSLLQNLLRINPIIVKEIRSRMRGPRVFITLTVILLAMGGAMFAMLQLILASARYTNVLSPQVGQALFAALAFLELFMICAITPAVTAGALSSEKEKQTYEMLMATPLSPTSILWGKLVSALSYVLLLLFAAVPLASVVFIFGGVAPRDMLKALIVLLGVAAAYGILGLFMSVLFGRTGRATVASFITVVLLMFGPLFLAALIGVIRGGEPPRWILGPSPISALSSAVASSMGPNMGGEIFYILGGLFNMGVSSVSQTSIPRPLYHYTLPFYTILSVLLYMLATRLIQPTRRWRLRAKEVATGVATLLVVVGLIVGAFFATASRYEWAVPVRNNLNPANGPQTIPAQPVFPDKQVVPAIPVDEATPTPATLPTGTPVGATAGQGPISAAAQAEIYAAAARQLLTVDNTLGAASPTWTAIYLVSLTDDRVGDPNEPVGDPAVLSSDLRMDISKRLGDLPPKTVWVQGKSEAPLDPKTGEVDGGQAAMLTFGNLHLQEDGSVHLSASLYFASLGATGKTYILSNSTGTWAIQGTTGAEWIS